MTLQRDDFDFHLGATVECTDGRCGKLAKIVVDPETEQVTDLIVAKGFLLTEDRVVPLSAVAGTSPDTVRLTIDSDALARHGAYDEAEYVAPPPGWEQELFTFRYVQYDIPSYRSPVGGPPLDAGPESETGGSATLEAIDRGTPVTDGSERLGTIDRVLTDEESGAITHLVVQRGALFGDYRLVPVALVTRVDAQGARVDLRGRDVEDLPKYQPDD